MSLPFDTDAVIFEVGAAAARPAPAKTVARVATMTTPGRTMRTVGRAAANDSIWFDTESTLHSSFRGD